MNVTVITSNKPYAMHDGSNTLFDYRTTPKFGLKKGGVHSGHVQTGISDSFCRVKGSNKGRCEVNIAELLLGDSCTILIFMIKEVVADID